MMGMCQLFPPHFSPGSECGFPTFPGTYWFLYSFCLIALCKLNCSFLYNLEVLHVKQTSMFMKYLENAMVLLLVIQYKIYVKNYTFSSTVPELRELKRIFNFVLNSLHIT